MLEFGRACCKGGCGGFRAKEAVIKEEVVMAVGEVELERCVEVAGGLYPSSSSNKIVPLF